MHRCDAIIESSVPAVNTAQWILAAQPSASRVSSRGSAVIPHSAFGYPLGVLHSLRPPVPVSPAPRFPGAPLPPVPPLLPCSTKSGRRPISLLPFLLVPSAPMLPNPPAPLRSPLASRLTPHASRPWLLRIHHSALQDKDPASTPTNRPGPPPNIRSIRRTSLFTRTTSRFTACDSSLLGQHVPCASSATRFPTRSSALYS